MDLERGAVFRDGSYDLEGGEGGMDTRIDRASEVVGAAESA